MDGRPVTLAILAVVLSGCAAGGPEGPAAAGAPVPADFSLDVIAWQGSERRGDDGPASAPGRIVLTCDGWLHWAPRQPHPAEALPPRHRRLSRGDVAGVWSLVRRLGLDEPSRRADAVNAKLLTPAPGETCVVVVVTAGGSRMTTARRGVSVDASMQEVIDAMMALAWAGGPPEPRRPPRRYDFGPDPYARYRR